MKNFFRVKQAFTLMELMLVIIIISSTYILVFSKSNFTIISNKSKIDLVNLKSFLLKNYDYETSLAFICIDEELSCFVSIDNNLSKENIIKNFFKFKPEIYEFNNIDEKIEYEDIIINNINYSVIFKYELNKDYKSNEFILDTTNGQVYEFNSLYEKAFIYKDKEEIRDKKEKIKEELKDAF